LIFSWDNQGLGGENFMAKLDTVYIVKGFFQNRVNKVAHYTIRRDEVKYYQHPISCAMELMETPTRRFCWKMNTRHFEEAKEQI
jgi:hypothetical protein